MYRIAIVRKGQPADRRICQTGGDLRDVVYEVIRAEGSEISNSDRPLIDRLLSEDRSQ